MKGLTSLDRNLRLDDEMSIDIRYADDTTLVSAVFEKLHIATLELEKTCHKWGLKINPLICAVLTTEKRTSKSAIILSPKLTSSSFWAISSPDDVLQIISMGSQDFCRLRVTIWTSRGVSKKLKIRLYKSLILTIAIYGSETPIPCWFSK